MVPDPQPVLDRFGFRGTYLYNQYMKIIFIRHGETTGDVEDRYGGDYDDHLSEKGNQQSKQVAESLKDRGIEIMYSSPLIRAKESADIIADKVGSTVVIEPSVKERNQYGILTGMVKAEAKEKHPEMVEALKDRMNTIEGAESYEDFSNRIIEAFQKLSVQTEHEVIGVLWHGGPMRVLFRDILKWGELKQIDDCSFVELQKYDDRWFYNNSNGLTFDFELSTGMHTK